VVRSEGLRGQAIDPSHPHHVSDLQGTATQPLTHLHVVFL
jgi:hypothetical protein